jgi:LAS superfamily LD-carboxypeptidase LdcB
VYNGGINSGKRFGTQVSVKGVNGYPNIFYTHIKNVDLRSGDKVDVGDYIGEISEWPGHKGSEHVHIGLPYGEKLKDLLDNEGSIFDGSKSEKKNNNTKKEVSKNLILKSPLKNWHVNSPYGPRWGRMHGGIDLRAKSGTELFSPAEGKVINAGDIGGGCGGFIKIQHSKNIFTKYCHIRKFNISTGDKVKEGELIGETGGGKNDNGRGNATGPHLHFEVWIDGNHKDPEKYIDVDIVSTDSQDDYEITQSKIVDELIDEASKSKFLEDLKKLAKETTKTFNNKKEKGKLIPYEKEVDMIQIALQFLGHSLPKWGVDGKFGPETEQAVKSFQSEFDKLDDNGIVDRKDLQHIWAKLVSEKFVESDLSKINFKGEKSVQDNIDVTKGNDGLNTLPTEIQNAIKKLKSIWGLDITDEHIKKEFEQEGKITKDAGGVDLNAMKDITKLVNDAKKQFEPRLNNLGIISGYRSYNEQVRNFGGKVEERGSIEKVQKWVALPGFSQHHSGKTFDIFSLEPSWWEKNSDVKEWVSRNAKKYGFEITYKNQGPLRGAEPWHLYYIK